MKGCVLAVVLRPDQRRQIGRANLRGVVQFVEIALAVGQHHQLRLGPAPGGGGRLLERFQPPETFFFINRFGIAAPFRGGSEPAAARADPHPQPVGRAKTPPREAGAIHKGLDQLWPNSVTRPPVRRPARQRQAQHLGGQIGALHRVAEVCATPLWHWPAPAARPIPATPVAHKPPGPAAGAWARAVAPPTR